ncbi:DUF2680 domain-containing protein [Salibacterium halotolerans]|uniref:DUF2680 domain-containing protein n=1 Tax=Salibacterium halotolerans TaxID=1884432 RepID=A0A1I5TEZ9_9BACI|nr:DUF2680 domain-containing protein [Salibacterium halotolerans]SFP81613.1 Protein of unknown function [Salibacterium halotolerans]
MRQKWMLIPAAAVALCLSGAPSGVAAEEEQSEEQKVELTEAQQKELAEIHSSILEKRKTLIDKYTEFGVVPEEKREKMKEQLDEGYAKLEERQFIPPHPHHWKKENDD